MSLGIGLKNKIRRSRAGGFTGLLDQPFATGATAAYSLRLLREKHSGGLVRVRADDSGMDKGEADVLPLLQPDGSKIITLNSPIENFSGTPFSGDGYVLADLIDAGNGNYDGLTSSWYDQSGNLNDASKSAASEQPQIVSGGTVLQENGKTGLSFDGRNDKLDTGLVPSQLDIGGSKPKTASFWVYTKAFDGGGILEFGTQNEGEDFSLRTENTANEWRAQFWGNADIRDIKFSSKNKWVNFVITWDGTTTRIYGDGSPISSAQNSLNTGDKRTFKIGGWNNSYLSGNIADLQVFGRALNLTEIKEMYNLTHNI